METKKIGKFQIIFAVIFFILAIFSSVYMKFNYYDKTISSHLNDITKSWRNDRLFFEQNTNSTDYFFMAKFISIVAIESSIYELTLPIFLLGELILIVLSIILFFQGLTNYYT